ncbi:MAG TPA: hypothetical protein VIX73_18505 [Kofleriaceae bacterium]
MSEPELDDEVRALLETALDSIEKFEIMQALRAAGRAMSPADLGAACHLGSEVVEDALVDLETANLITREGDGGVRPGRGCTDPRFAHLMQLYMDDSASVLATLSSVAVQRIRSMAATAFADALVRKRRSKDG